MSSLLFGHGIRLTGQVKGQLTMLLNWRVLPVQRNQGAMYIKRYDGDYRE